jgi:hypothetical protein
LRGECERSAAAFDLPGHRLRLLLQQRPEQLALVLEVVVERPPGHAGGRDDLRRGGGGETLEDELLARRSQQRLAGGPGAFGVGTACTS